MDLREKKTKRSIKNAFLKLRSQKALERITVKELAELAEISKTTFYLHYKDIYDLSEQMQNEVIENILASISHPEYLVSNYKGFIEELFYAFHSQQSLIETLFSGSQNSVLPTRIEEKIRIFIQDQYPNMNQDFDMRLTYNVYGSYYVYQKYYKTTDMDEIIRIVGNAKASIG